MFALQIDQLWGDISKEYKESRVFYGYEQSIIERSNYNPE